MTERRDFLGELRDANASLDEQRLRPAAVRRIGRRMDSELGRTSGHRRARWIPMFAFAAGAALVLLVLAWGSGGPEPAQVEPPRLPAASLAQSVAVRGDGCLRTDGHDTVAVQGICEVVSQHPPLAVRTLAATSLTIARHRVTMTDGTAAFEVEPTHDSTLRVSVPGGDLVVVGTRFQLVVDGDNGHVDLYEGKLRFEGDNGRVQNIEAGQRFGFSSQGVPPPSDAPQQPLPSTEQGPDDPRPLPAPAKISAQPDRAEPARRAPKPDRAEPARRAPKPVDEPALKRPSNAPLDASAVVEQVTALRAAGQYGEAAKVLRRALRDKWPRRAGEVLSYELGAILTRHLGDRVSACAHWRDHLRRYAQGRYARDVAKLRAEASCER